MFRKWLWSSVAMVLAVAPVTGCGRSNGRLGLSGSVRLDGAAVDGGAIELFPVAGPNLTTAGAMIIDGNYRVPAKQGLLPGAYGVRISCPERHDGPGTIAGISRPAPRERIPDRYNLKSELTVEIKPDSSNRFDFDLSSATR